MWDVIISKQFDINLGIALAFFGAILGWLLAFFLPGESGGGGKKSTTNVQNVTITTINKYAINNYASSGQNSASMPDEMARLIVGISVFFMLTAYFFLQSIVLDTLLYGGIFLLFMWCGAVATQMIGGQFTGFAWKAYLLYVAFFSFAFFAACQLALAPIYHPQYWSYVEAIMRDGGWIGIKKYFNFPIDLLFACCHLVGILLLFITLFNMLLSLMHIIFSGQHLISGQTQTPWYVRATARFFSPKRNVVSFTIMLAIAVPMVSGLVPHWIQYEIPRGIQHLFQIILHGVNTQ